LATYEPMQRNKAVSPAVERLAGIEWMRGLAAFGVICIHSGLTVHNNTTPASDIIRMAFDFAVPFFLMLSFFFAIRAEVAHPISWNDWCQRRASRLLIPFVFWSTVYFTLHLAKLTAHHQTGDIKALLSDPSALILSGGTGVALYFLPLLLTGLALVHLLSGSFARFPAWALALGFLAALDLQKICDQSAFAHDTTPPPLIEAPYQFLLGIFLLGTRCLPIIFAAALLTRCLPSPTLRNGFLFLPAGVIVLVLSHHVTIPGSARDTVLGLGGFMMAWGLSGFLPVSQWAAVVGLFSFGVYLVHQVFLELIQVFIPHLGKLGVIGTLVVSGSVYVVSMLIVGLANRGGPFIRKIFGLK
jgi:peptidoglycan/LPS O-acetylase OafA/YrhL